MNKIEDDTDGKIYHILGLEESVLSNNYTTQVNIQNQCDAYQINNGIFRRTRTKSSKLVWKSVLLKVFHNLSLERDNSIKFELIHR